VSLPQNEWVTGQELAIREFNSIRGRLLSVIEAMDLPERQEQATKALIKQLTYSSQEVIAQILSHATHNRTFRYQENQVEVKH
jgi:hypothetical protein